MTMAANPAPVTAAPLREAANQGIRHGFFTRAGGVSRGIYAGLNVGLGSGDERSAVHENRSRVAASLGVGTEMLVSPFQVHSPDVVTVEGPFTGERPRADGIVTATPGLAIAVVTADCGPVLFADPQAGVVGAAHAGWKGALAGVLENTVSAMEAIGARRERILAVLGPSISREAYEVGPEFVERFAATDPDCDRWFAPSPRDGHAMFDLQGYTVDRLLRAGVQASMTGHCTYAGEHDFYSYRRKTHRGEPDYGRQMSAIVLEGKA
ncbi:MAG: polyphenol oxidase [Phyllobacteriaceae bacterium]|nr:polyphenol oxidase [Phyllobacteriaceae bacterium]MBA92005.1 polyphenol oxidase [Phyllobacteriaceae bacterium]